MRSKRLSLDGFSNSLILNSGEPALASTCLVKHCFNRWTYVNPEPLQRESSDRSEDEEFAPVPFSEKSPSEASATEADSIKWHNISFRRRNQPDSRLDSARSRRLNQRIYRQVAPSGNSRPSPPASADAVRETRLAYASGYHSAANNGIVLNVPSK